MINLIEKEKIILKLNPKKYFFTQGFLAFNFSFKKKIIVTNKRIVVSCSFFGFEKFKPMALSYWFQESDYNSETKINSAYILEHNIETNKKGNSFLKIKVNMKPKATIKIYDESVEQINEMIKENT